MLAFCERYQIAVVTPIWDRGSVDECSPVFLGVIGAASGGPRILGEADCILMAGAVSDYRVGYLQPPAVRSDAQVLTFSGDWQELDEACRRRKMEVPADWLDECVRRRDRFRSEVEQRGEEQARAGLHSIHIIRAVERVLSDHPALLIDGGTIGQWAHQLLCSTRYPGDWLTCGRSGVVGWGVGGAMAARLAFPGRPVILLSGDGAFTFNIADIESAARQGLGFAAIVADDQGWGITRTGHIRQFGEPIASSLGPIAFDEAARAFGARGMRPTTPEAIEHELREAIHRSDVTVIHVPIIGGHPS
jgi:acetolactate synthase-1/2/3 large subunit